MSHTIMGFGEVSIATAGTGNDLWLGPTQTQPGIVSAGFNPSIVSSSAEDSSGATGAIAVEVHYVDTGYLINSETITLNGLTPVAMSATNVLFVQCMHVTTAGSAGVSVGDIDLKNSATVMKRISAGKNRCLSSMRVVPDGYNLEINQFAFGGDSKNGTATGRLVANSLDGKLIDSGVFVEQDSITVNDNTVLYVYDPPLSFPQRTEVKIKVDTTANSSYASGKYNGRLVKA